MIYTNCTITSIDEDFAWVFNDDTGMELKAWFPSVLSREPKVGDRVVIDKDDVDYENSSFVRFYGEKPVILNAHVHQLLDDNTIDNMQISDEQKSILKSKKTGGVA